MSRSHLYALILIIGTIFFSTSCQKDNYEEPKLIPKTYSFNIPNRISFNFSQLSENRESIIPYTNTLVLKNISNGNFSGKYAVFAFKETVQNFNNIAFIKYGNFTEVATETNSDDINLETSDNLFTDDNVIASILNFNNASSDHNLNGFYTGELNIFSPAADEESEPTFIRSLTSTGMIDFEGQFHFFIHNNDEDDVVQLKGNFNSNNLISGNALNRIGENLSPISNIDSEQFILTNNNLMGSIMFSANSEERILKFNLIKQN